MKILKFSRMVIWSIALFTLSALANAANGGAGSTSFSSSGTFNVPIGVSSVRVLLIGGGGAGAGSHYRGGGSGYLNADTLSVNGGENITITVGAGGLSAGCAGNACTGGDGGVSSFGNLLQAAGGIGGGGGAGTGDGGSGGGGAGNSGFGGAGGSAGANGVAGNTDAGGVGQGTGVWTSYLALITEAPVTAGTGGIPSTGSNQGGGGGGGVLLGGSGPSGQNGGSTAAHTGAFGGIGYGSGGGSGGYINTAGYAVGGDGASGLVYVEWSEVSIPAKSIPTMSAYGLALTMLVLLWVASRRLRVSVKRD